jgi:hypothetical protein
MNKDVMQEAALEIMFNLHKTELNPHQMMYVLARLFVTGCYADGVSKEEAIGRFIEVADHMYDMLANRENLQ